ncbi:hypothetical protein BD779DRAFT_1478771 [Infundibulicybe gibba]|nr:hypothetical protein BD779DRAFT_1478771 [Infundibulicybe gibba]
MHKCGAALNLAHRFYVPYSAYSRVVFFMLISSTPSLGNRLLMLHLMNSIQTTTTSKTTPVEMEKGFLLAPSVRCSNRMRDQGKAEVLERKAAYIQPALLATSSTCHRLSAALEGGRGGGSLEGSAGGTGIRGTTDVEVVRFECPSIWIFDSVINLDLHFGFDLPLIRRISYDRRPGLSTVMIMYYQGFRSISTEEITRMIASRMWGLGRKKRPTIRGGNAPVLRPYWRGTTIRKIWQKSGLSSALSGCCIVPTTSAGYGREHAVYAGLHDEEPDFDANRWVMAAAGYEWTGALRRVFWDRSLASSGVEGVNIPLLIQSLFSLSRFSVQVETAGQSSLLREALSVSICAAVVVAWMAAATVFWKDVSGILYGANDSITAST